MLEKIGEKIIQYFGLLDDIVVDTLTDLKSLRYQLVIWAFVLNFVVLYLVYLGKSDYKLAAVSMALLTAVYAFFFHSKNKEAEMNSNSAPVEVLGDPDLSDKDPDNIQ